MGGLPLIWDICTKPSGDFQDLYRTDLRELGPPDRRCVYTPMTLCPIGTTKVMLAESFQVDLVVQTRSNRIGLDAVTTTTIANQLLCLLC